MATMYWIGGSGSWDSTTAGHWSNTSGGVSNGSVPTSATDVVFNSSSGSGAVTLDDDGSGSPFCKSLTATSSSITITNGTINGLHVANGNVDISGFTSSTGMTLVASTTTTNRTFTSGGKTLNDLTLNASPGGTSWTFQDDVASANNVALNSTGDYALNGKNVTAKTISLGGSGTVNLGSGTISLSGTSGNIFDPGTATITPSTSTIKFTGSGTPTFLGNGKTYNNFWNACSSGTCLVSGSNTFNDFKINAGLTQQFVAGTTTTVTTFTASGALGNLITVGSSTAASHTLTKAGGGTISCSYMSISRSTATPAATWSASNSTDGGNNSGWSFAVPSGFFNFF